MKKFETWYNSNYKKLLILPTIVLALSLFYLVFFYAQTGDIINKDVTLTGGTAITIQTESAAQDLEAHLSKSIQDFEIKKISDNTGAQLDLIITTKDADVDTLKTSLEEVFSFLYKAKVGDLVENEFDHVFIGFYEGPLKLNKKEAEDYKWIKFEDLKNDVLKNPLNYTEWFKVIYERVWQVKNT